MTAVTARRKVERRMSEGNVECIFGMLVHPRTRGVILAFMAELLIDCEEDRTLRAVLVGMLREGRPERLGLSIAATAEQPPPEGRLLVSA
ncbi:MAG: hypothetical protein WB297_10750 [Actinomycetota bacterium]